MHDWSTEKKDANNQLYWNKKKKIKIKELIIFVDADNKMHQIGAKDNASSHQKNQMNYAIIM